MESYISNSAIEPVRMKHKTAGRFIPYLNKDFLENLHCHYEFLFALEEELSRIKNQIVRVPGLSSVNREFKDYNADLRAALFLCTRITNASKALFILKKYQADFSNENLLRMCSALEHIISVLQQEYFSLFNEFYCPLLKSESSYRNVYCRNLCFTEYIIHTDMWLYFDNTWSDNFYAYNRNALMHYMVYIYLQIEAELLSHDFSSDLYHMQQESSFISFHNYKKEVKEELEFWYSFISHCVKQVPVSILEEHFIKRKIIVMGNNSKAPEE